MSGTVYKLIIFLSFSQCIWEIYFGQLSPDVCMLENTHYR